MPRRLTVITLCLCATALLAAPPAPILFSQVDLTQFGLTFPPAGQTPNTDAELLLLTNDRLVVLLTHLEDGRIGKPADLLVMETRNGAILQHRKFPAHEATAPPGQQPQRLSPTEFALAAPHGALRCNLDLQCRDEPLLAGQLRVSTDGNLLLLGNPGPGQNVWLGFDRHLTLLQRYRNDPFSDIAANPFGTVLSTDAGLQFFPTDQTTHRTLTREKDRFAQANHTILYLTSAAHRLPVPAYQLLATKDTGHPLYRLDLHLLPGLPWNPDLTADASGRLFAVHWTRNAWWQLLHLLACIDECPPPPAFERVALFHAVDGSLAQAFLWDPRPWNLHAVPALSPDGTRIALVQRNLLTIYALP